MVLTGIVNGSVERVLRRWFNVGAGVSGMWWEESLWHFIREWIMVDQSEGLGSMPLWYK